MVADLIRALLAAMAVCVLPGYFWAATLRPASGLAERVAYSTALSMASVPVVAVATTAATGGGVTLWVAVVSVAAVFLSGMAVFLRAGASPEAGSPVLPRPGPVRDHRTLLLMAAAFALALATVVVPRAPAWLLIVIATAVAAAGILAGRTALARGHQARAAQPAGTSPAHTSPAPAGPAAQARRRFPRWLRPASLAFVIVATGYRGYAGVLTYDWPSIRGGDHFSYAVMAEQMLIHGQYHAYLIYPPGVPALTAVICRICGLTPLQLFPVLAPALLVVTALGAYALATRLWGGWFGILAAALSGLVLTGAYGGFAAGRYPDLIAAYFLIVIGITALISTFAAPSWRSGTLVAVTASSVVFYHSVAALYLLAVMVVVCLTSLPYLLVKRLRREASTLALALAGVAGLSACYAAYVYDLPTLFTGHSATDQAVAVVLGSQAPRSPAHLLTALSPAIVWLGLFGVAAVAVSLRRRARPSQVLTVVTLVAWCVLMYAGSRFAADGFPHRFERDLGAPLSVMAALAPGLVLRTLLDWRPSTRLVTSLSATAAAADIALVAVVQAATAISADTQPAGGLPTGQVLAAGRWLAQHNSGGNIISTPDMNPGVTNRAVLAMGGYTALQSYAPHRVTHPRSLPTAGAAVLVDSRDVLLHPGSCAAAAVLAGQDVRYVVVYKAGPGVDLAGFQADPARYRPVFENRSVIIYAPHRVPCTGG